MNFNLRSGYSQDSEDQFQLRQLNDMMAIIGVFTKDAMELAGTYCLHAERKSVTRTDVELGLKTRAYYGDLFWNSPDVQQKISEMKEFLNTPGEESGEESDYESNSDYEYDENVDEGEMSELPDEEMDEDEDEEMDDDEEMDEPFIESKCTCAICTTLNGIREKWITWNPSERLDISVKNSIENTFPSNL